MNFIESALKYRQITFLFTLILVIVGVNSLLHMPRREDPKLTIRQGLVIMVYPGAKVVQMEEQVTKKVESLLFRYSEVDKEDTKSTTQDSEMVIQVELQDWVTNSDKFWSKVRHDLQELTKTDLPQGVIGPFINSDFGDTVALLISVSSDRHDYSSLEDFIEILEDELRPLPEVSKLKRYGEQQEQIYVTLDARNLSRYGLSEHQVVQVLRSMNTITYAGEIKTDNSVIPIHTTNSYNSVAQIKQQVIDISPQGGIVRLQDVATVTRTYEEPTSFVRVNDRKAILLSVEMQDGFNIVEFGHKTDVRIAAAQARIPADVKFKKIIDQPVVVGDNIHHFMKEFVVAIVAVIIVTMLLLPLRIAAVAALAIPITIMITFGVLDYLNINLQQMTLAGLIVVLGMVVDNAIVIVDDYVEHLDRGAPLWEATVKCAQTLFVPVLTATLAIICAFLPLAIILTGNAGEFLFTLPVAVTVALLVSLVVAILLIPLLCNLFIKTGLRSIADAKQRTSLLDVTQKVYNVVLDKAFKYPAVPIILGIVAVLGAVFVGSRLQVRMFPFVERNQFCLELYMNSGTKVEHTDQEMRRLEAFLRADERVVDISSFVGTSSPRFYITYTPQNPDPHYGQLLISTISAEATNELVTELVSRLDDYIPNGEILVKQLVQGPPVDAPIEVRVTGNDLQEIKAIGKKIKTILNSSDGANYIRTTFQQDRYGIEVKINEEVANRLGFSNQGIAQTLAAGFKGFPVSTLWEGDTPVKLILRLEEEDRRVFEDINNIYISSPLSGGRIPLRQLVKLEPEWQTGQVVRRNGIRTLTVRSEAQLGKLPNNILNEIRPEIEKIPLPIGISISYGGELEDQKTVIQEQSTSLFVSLVLIFIVLLLQFRDIRKALVIMVAIPMSWFGALLGLYVTGNPFSCTGFIGIISLSGLVVRNGIILVEYADKLAASEETMSLRDVAINAGKRRMRPVFLTAMAAAVGVIPMIIGGSSLWAPLGSVLSMGLIFGMVLTLLVLPVLYWLVLRPGRKKVPKNQIERLEPLTASKEKQLL